MELVLSRKVHKELEHRVRVCEGAADDVLQLDQQLVGCVEGFEAVSPVVDVQVALLVWV